MVYTHPERLHKKSESTPPPKKWTTIEETILQLWVQKLLAILWQFYNMLPKLTLTSLQQVSKVNSDIYNMILKLTYLCPQQGSKVNSEVYNMILKLTYLCP